MMLPIVTDVWRGLCFSVCVCVCACVSVSRANVAYYTDESRVLSESSHD